MWEDTSSNQNFTAANALASTENLFLRLFAYPFLLRMISKKRRNVIIMSELKFRRQQTKKLSLEVRKQAQRKDMAAWRPQSWGWKNQGWNLVSHQGLGLSCAFIISVSEAPTGAMHWTGAEMAKAQRQERAWHFENMNSAQIREKESSENQVMKGLPYVLCQAEVFGDYPQGKWTTKWFQPQCAWKDVLFRKVPLTATGWSSVDYCDHRWEMTAAWPWSKAAGWGTQQWRAWTSPREQEQPGLRDWLDLL